MIVITVKVELAIIELDCVGTLEGLSVDHVIANSPATAILIYTTAQQGHSRRSGCTGKRLIITPASLANPCHIRATVRSVARGLIWSEPCVQGQWSELGDRPRSVEDRRKLMQLSVYVFLTGEEFS